MKRIKFWMQGSCIGSEIEDIMEYPDDVSEKEIQQDFRVWMFEESGAYYDEVDNEES